MVTTSENTGRRETGRSGGNEIMKVSGHQDIGRPKLRWSDDIRKGSDTGRSTGPENKDSGNVARRLQIGKRRKKMSLKMLDFRSCWCV